MLDFKASGDWDFEHGDDVFGFQLESATSVANSHISKHINVSAKRDLDDEDDYSDVSFSDTRRAPRRDQAHSWDEECDLCGDYYTGLFFAQSKSRLDTITHSLPCRLGGPK
jgi:hypothetical protein